MITSADTGYKDIDFIFLRSCYGLEKTIFSRKREREIEMKCRKLRKRSKRNRHYSGNSEKSEKHTGNHIPFLHGKVSGFERGDFRNLLNSCNGGKFGFLERHGKKMD